jgi:tetratricopeptide (TPR) repeat protein
MVLHQAGQLVEALAAVDAALRQDPGSADALALRGALLMELGRPQEAIAAFDGALARQPSADVLTNRAAAQLLLRRKEDALASLASAAALAADSASVHFNHAVLLLDTGRLEAAVAAFERTTALAPDLFEAWNFRGAGLFQLGRYVEALASYDRALALDASQPAVWTHRGHALNALQEFRQAVASYDRALSLKPDDLDARLAREAAITAANLASFDAETARDPDNGALHCRRGVALLALGRYEDAVTAFDRAEAVGCDSLDLWFNRGVALQTLRRFEAADSNFARALAFDPDHADALMARARLWLEQRRYEEGVGLLRARAERLFPISAWAEPGPEHKQRHDAEQRAYLAGQGIEPDKRPYYAPGARVAGGAVNPANAQAAAAEWAQRDTKVAVIDNLLTQPALDALRRFCLDSTIWRRAHRIGYMGAMAEHGFASPLLAQIAEELAQVFPSIIGDHGLGTLWAFKYDSDLPGIRIHADQAAVNVNFWLTPDDANLNPQSGGIIVWDKCAPDDWDFAKYNGDEAAVRAYLAQAGARPITVPYRSNRAVIFDSDLFHETDRIEFKPGYLNRRINVTMLYGRRTWDGG